VTFWLYNFFILFLKFMKLNFNIIKV
jgi:hypothetical protein